jgi:hypothetical protein
MRKIFALFVVLVIVLAVACDKEEEPEPKTPYELLTMHVWVSDSLLADGQDAGGEGQLLAAFNGDAEFRTDGTGTFGEFTGTWSLSEDNTEITIISPDLPVTIIANIEELTESSLKITTGFPNIANPNVVIAIRMTFKKKTV